MDSQRRLALFLDLVGATGARSSRKDYRSSGRVKAKKMEAAGFDLSSPFRGKRR